MDYGGLQPAMELMLCQDMFTMNLIMLQKIAQEKTRG
jgi:hypothetical protein